MDNSKPYTDNRGTITDLLVTPEYSITHITFKEGAIRGNHYHEKTNQYDLILKGRLLSSYKSEIEKKEQVITTGYALNFPPNVAHAYKALEDSEMISICFGVRRGSDYEKDVVRLKDEDKLIV